jgi:hypothetical protein
MGKVTDEQAVEIRRLKKEGARIVDLEKQFGVTRFAIYDIIKGTYHNPETRDNPSRARGNFGRRNPNAKLDADAVFVMRWLYSNNIASGTMLTELFGISSANTTKILNRNWWKQVPETIENIPSNLRSSVRIELREEFQRMFGEAGPALLDILTENGFKLEKEVAQNQELKVSTEAVNAV